MSSSANIHRKIKGRGKRKGQSSRCPWFGTLSGAPASLLIPLSVLGIHRHWPFTTCLSLLCLFTFCLPLKTLKCGPSESHQLKFLCISSKFKSVRSISRNCHAFATTCTQAFPFLKTVKY